MNRKMNRKFLYQCKICNYVLKPKDEDPKPAYCPNCALHSHKGEMVLIDGTREYDTGSEILNAKK